jgi:exonuclease III
VNGNKKLHSKNTYKDLKILSLNCCALKKRVNYPEFKDLIKRHDILCFQETKTDDIDVLEIDGYEIKMKNRVKYGRVNSGGITLVYKRELNEFINIHETECKFVLWFEISKQITGYDKKSFIRAVYIPPENSKYSRIDAFSLIELEMKELNHDEKHVIFAGDFNARTASDIEFFNANDTPNKEFEEIFESMHNEIDLPQKNQKRNNEDKVRNTYGKLLIEMCKSNKLLIINGRIGDNVYGKLTCKGISTVDYFICDYFIYTYVSNMQVMEHSILFSYCVTFESTKL